MKYIEIMSFQDDSLIRYFGKHTQDFYHEFSEYGHVPVELWERYMKAMKEVADLEMKLRNYMEEFTKEDAIRQAKAKGWPQR